jgi:hypothetical protein
MLGLVAPTVIGLAASVGLGGSARLLFSQKIRWWPAVVVAFAVELLLYNPPIDGQTWAMQIGPWIWIASRLVFLAVLVVNAAHSTTNAVKWSWWMAAVGVALNTLVVVANGGHMPQSMQAAVAVWGAGHIDPTRLQNVAPLGADTRLPWLADVVAEPRWLPRANVISVGDLLLAFGMASWAFTGARVRKQTVTFD